MNPRSIADAMLTMATNDGLRAQCIERGLHQSALFSWDRAARESIAVFTETPDWIIVA